MAKDYMRLHVDDRFRWSPDSPKNPTAGEAEARLGPFAVRISVARNPGHSHTTTASYYRVRAWLGRHPGVTHPVKVCDETGYTRKSRESWQQARRVVVRACNAYLRSLDYEDLCTLPGVEGVEAVAPTDPDPVAGTLADDLPRRIRWRDGAPSRRTADRVFGTLGRLRVRATVEHDPAAPGFVWTSEVWAPPDVPHTDLEHAEPGHAPDRVADRRTGGRDPRVADAWRRALDSVRRDARRLTAEHGRTEWTYGTAGPQSLATRRWRRRHQRDA